jgi:hypothetical protein
MLFAGGVGVLLLATLEYFFPGFYLGPAQAMDPQLREIWFDRLVQSQSLFRTDVPDGRHYAVVTAFVLAYAVPTLWVFRTRADCEARRRIDFLLVAIVGCFAMTLVFRRAASPLALFCALPLGLLGDALNERSRVSALFPENRLIRIRRGVARKGFVFLCAMTPHLVLSATDAVGSAQGMSQIRENGDEFSRAVCQQELHRWIQEDRIAQISGLDSALVITRASDAPALLFWTDHRVLAWNHHRSTDGLMLLDRFFRADSDDDLRDVIVETGVDLVLYCPSRSVLEPYWNRGGSRPPPTWMTLLAGEHSGKGPRLLGIAEDPSI